MTKGTNKKIIHGIDCSDLEMEKDNYIHPCRPWTAAEIAILKEYYNKVDPNLLVKKLNRSLHGIRTKAQTERINTKLVGKQKI
jgi:hypothetical protein